MKITSKASLAIFFLATFYPLIAMANNEEMPPTIPTAPPSIKAAWVKAKKPYLKYGRPTPPRAPASTLQEA